MKRSIVVPVGPRSAPLAVSRLAQAAELCGADVVIARSGGSAIPELRDLELPADLPAGERLRRGLLHASDHADVVGYLDARVSVAPEDAAMLFAAQSTRSLDVVIGARVRLSGSRIERKHLRHSVGRIFAEAAAAVLRLGVYDTQCQAKVFRVTPLLREVLAEPFLARWAYEVELLGRLLARDPGLASSRFAELPVSAWEDPAAASVPLRALAETPAELLRVELDLRRRRA